MWVGGRRASCSARAAPARAGIGNGRDPGRARRARGASWWQRARSGWGSTSRIFATSSIARPLARWSSTCRRSGAPDAMGGRLTAGPDAGQKLIYVARRRLWNDDHVAWREARKFVGHAAEQHARQSTLTASPDDDGIDPPTQGDLDDRLRRITPRGPQLEIGHAQTFRAGLRRCEDFMRQQLQSIADVALGAGKLAYVLAWKRPVYGHDQQLAAEYFRKLCRNVNRTVCGLRAVRCHHDVSHCPA